MSLGNSLRIGTSGMQLAQLGLGTVSHNIANINTVGYSRQQVQTSATSANGFGNGVQLDSIQRITDRFIASRQINAGSDTAFATQRRTLMESLENTLSNAGSQGGLDATVGSFIESLNQASNEPGNSALKRNVIQQADLLARTLQDVGGKLKTIATDADNAISADLAVTNQIIKDIYNLNIQITAQGLSSSNGANANDLLDARATKINQLAERFKIQVSENTSNGGVRITTENGRKLVDDVSYVQLTRTTGSPYSAISVQNVKVDGTLDPTLFDINTATLTSGKIKALVDVRDTNVPNLLAQIDQFTSTLITQVNRLSSQGSSFPPVRALTSANTTVMSSTASNMFTDLDPALANQSFHISVVDTLGNPVASTINGTAVTIPGLPGPYSLTNLANTINANGAVSATMTATALTNSDGRPILQIQANNPNHRIVLSNNSSGNPLGILGMNNLFTGTSSTNIAVASGMLNNPDNLPTARMRTTDGGLSSLDNRNITDLAKLADTKFSIPAAGGLAAQTATLVGYTTQVAGNLAVQVADAKDRVSFNENLKQQLDQSLSSIAGVNINEELSQMLVYQNSFQASARIITVVNEMLQELVNIIR
ncbi:MAG: flagellar hook-associated protein FlgK [Proteobacteria bacterium]|nr:flagellar hook-associated protein FlgK [Pseudomonadota bacterium]NBX86399.1 flagellar hook-associated protein FlgK [Pseudomonadota bacterium]